MKTIIRENYLNVLESVKGTPDIKIITGVRRCGKSKLLDSYIRLLTKDKKNNIIFVNLQEAENEELLDYHKLHDFALEHHKKNKNNFLIIDEVQLCIDFEKAINSLHTKEMFDIYLTGSNAFLLSSDLATLFTGRTYQIEVYPFSFKEYLKYFEREDVDNAFEDYVKEGGFAGSYLYKNIEQKYNYIEKEVYNTIIERDIISKYKIRKKDLFNNVSNYLIDNTSNLISSRRIEKYLLNTENSSSHNTITNFINYLNKAFVFYSAKRFDLKGKKYLSTEYKYYLSDHSIKYALLGTKQQDYGRILENIVYIELLRRGYEVYIGKLYQKEIDFVVKKRNEQIYIQVSAYIDNPDTFNREVTSLLNIRDSYPKMLIARTHQNVYYFEGIKIIDIAEWLSKEN